MLKTATASWGLKYWTSYNDDTEDYIGEDNKDLVEVCVIWSENIYLLFILLKNILFFIVPAS